MELRDLMLCNDSGQLLRSMLEKLIVEVDVDRGGVQIARRCSEFIGYGTMSS